MQAYKPLGMLQGQVLGNLGDSVAARIRRNNGIGVRQPIQVCDDAALQLEGLGHTLEC